MLVWSFTVWWHSGRLLTLNPRRVCPSNQKSKMKNLKGSTEHRGWQRENLPSPPSDTFFKSNTYVLTWKKLFLVCFSLRKSSWSPVRQWRPEGGRAGRAARHQAERTPRPLPPAPSGVSAPTASRVSCCFINRWPACKSISCKNFPHNVPPKVYFGCAFEKDQSHMRAGIFWFWNFSPPGIFLNTCYATYYWEIELLSNKNNINIISYNVNIFFSSLCFVLI